MRNVAKHAEHEAWYIGELVKHLEGTLQFLTVQEGEALQSLMNNPPEALKNEPAVEPKMVLITAEEFLALADDVHWEWARAIVAERARQVA